MPEEDRNVRDVKEGFNPRAIFPSGPAIKLSEKMRGLAVPKHVSQRWMAAEIQKLIPEAIRLEEAPAQYAAIGFFGALTLGMIAYVLLRGGL